MFIFCLTVDIESGVEDIRRCRIPEIDPFRKETLQAIAAESKAKDKPACLDPTKVKFKIDEEYMNLVRKDPNSTYWDTVTCCLSGYGTGIKELRSNSEI
jgi:hypothetical protein